MREMKDSGIDTVGKVPADWKSKRLKYLCNVQTGNEDTQNADPDGLYPFYVRSPIAEKSMRYTFDGEGILVAGDGAGAGRVFHHVYGKYAVHQRVYRLSGFDFNSDFLYYYLCNLFPAEMDKGSAQSTVPSIRLPMLESFSFILPSKNEANKIVNFLDLHCAKIDVVTKSVYLQIETLEQYKNSIISEAVTKGLNRQVKTRESGIRWCPNIPVHWKTDRGKFILQLLERPVYEDDGVITCFRDGEVTLRSKRREDGFTVSLQEAGYQGIEPGDLVVHGMDGFAGAIGISDSRGKGTPVLNVMDSQQNKRYLMYYLRWIAKIGVFESLSTGIRVRSCDTNWNKLRELPYIVPPIEEQDAIAKYLDEKCAKIDEAIADKRKLLDILDNYKKSLIFEYVTGKKEVL